MCKTCDYNLTNYNVTKANDYGYGTQCNQENVILIYTCSLQAYGYKSFDKYSKIN